MNDLAVSTETYKAVLRVNYLLYYVFNRCVHVKLVSVLKIHPPVRQIN